MLRTRVLTALALLFAFLAALFGLPPWGWSAVALSVAVVAAREWAALLGGRRGAQLAYCAGVGALTLAMLLSDSLADTSSALLSFAVSAAFWCIVAPLWLVRKWRIASPAGAVTGIVVIVPTALALVLLRAVSPYLVLAVMAVIWVADISAYFVGRAFGRHKLAPQISPGKSWEGAAGAGGGVLIYGLVVLHLSGHDFDAGAMALLIGLLLAITALSVLGDLFESLAKRQIGVKDSGSVLPGHGGLLDRIDSMTATLPIIALLSVTPALHARLGL